MTKIRLPTAENPTLSNVVSIPDGMGWGPTATLNSLVGINDLQTDESLSIQLGKETCLDHFKHYSSDPFISLSNRNRFIEKEKTSYFKIIINLGVIIIL